MYAVRHIKDAGGYIAAIIEKRKADARKKPRLTEYYVRLFEILAHSDELMQPGWAYCFNEGEFGLLAEYIFRDGSRKPAEIHAMLAPYGYVGDKGYFDILYGLWQDHCGNPSYAYIFDMIGKSAGLKKYFAERYGIDAGELAGFAVEGRAVEYFCSVAGKGAGGEYGAYCGNLKKLGIREHSALYGKCVNMYALVCDGAAYLRMGAETISNIMKKLGDGGRITMMRNMLSVLDSFQLKKLVSVFPLFNEYMGSNYSESYNSVMSHISGEARKRYLLWKNQYYIYSVLGEGERADFWMGYADRGTFTKHEYADIIFLCFEGFTVIEYKNVDAAYFFNSIYFEKKIEPYICDMRTEQDIEDWIYSNAEWGLDKSHKDHWRKAHVGSWQYDMKSYIGGLLAGR